MLSHSSHRSRGFTLIELLVVISIIAILAGMLLPVIAIVRDMANQQKCGKQMSQIQGALVAYSTDEGTAWPDPRIPADKTKQAKYPLAAGQAVPPGEEAARYTAAAFELLAASQSLPNKLFACPSASSGGPDKELKASVNREDTSWGWMGVQARVSYAFDWASPSGPPSGRVLLADRDLVNHKNDVMCVFGDGHVAKLKAEPVSAGGPGGDSTTGVIKDPDRKVYNPDAKGAWDEEDDADPLTPDDIFSSEGDAQDISDCLKPGAGHTLRAFVK